MADLLHFRRMSQTMLGCYLVLDGEDPATGGELIASINGPSTLNIPLREAFILLCQGIVDDMCDKSGKPRPQWNPTRYVDPPSAEIIHLPLSKLPKAD